MNASVYNRRRSAFTRKASGYYINMSVGSRSSLDDTTDDGDSTSITSTKSQRSFKSWKRLQRNRRRKQRSQSLVETLDLKVKQYPSTTASSSKPQLQRDRVSIFKQNHSPFVTPSQERLQRLSTITQSPDDIEVYYSSDPLTTSSDDSDREVARVPVYRKKSGQVVNLGSKLSKISSIHESFETQQHGLNSIFKTPVEPKPEIMSSTAWQVVELPDATIGENEADVSSNTQDNNYEPDLSHDLSQKVPGNNDNSNHSQDLSNETSGHSNDIFDIGDEIHNDTQHNGNVASDLNNGSSEPKEKNFDRQDQENQELGSDNQLHSHVVHDQTTESFISDNLNHGNKTQGLSNDKMHPSRKVHDDSHTQYITDESRDLARENHELDDERSHIYTTMEHRNEVHLHGNVLHGPGDDTTDHEVHEGLDNEGPENVSSDKSNDLTNFDSNTVEQITNKKISVQEDSFIGTAEDKKLMTDNNNFENNDIDSKFADNAVNVDHGLADILREEHLNNSSQTNENVGVNVLEKNDKGFERILTNLPYENPNEILGNENDKLLENNNKVDDDQQDVVGKARDLLLSENNNAPVSAVEDIEEVFENMYLENSQSLFNLVEEPFYDENTQLTSSPITIEQKQESNEELMDVEDEAEEDPIETVLVCRNSAIVEASTFTKHCDEAKVTSLRRGISPPEKDIVGVEKETKADSNAVVADESGERTRVDEKSNENVTSSCNQEHVLQGGMDCCIIL